MTSHPNGQLFTPPELPSYLKNVYDLKPVVDVPSDDEVVGILAVIRVANQAVDVQDMGDPILLARLSEHLFNVQMAKYRSKYLGIFPEDAIFKPPALPAHLSVYLTPVTGAPSEDEIIQVQSAIRSYQKYGSSPSMFDPRLDMELSQHLFDIQMARYTQRARQSHTSSSMSYELPTSNPARKVQRSADVAEELHAATNNAGSGSIVVDSNQLVHVLQDAGICNAIEQSNRLAEQANQLAKRSNQLIERSNQIAERSNQLVEQSGQPGGQSNKLFKKFNELFERFNEHLEESNNLAEESTKPTERLGDALENINRVLVKIQHAIIRNHRGNTKNALDCLVNERGEVPCISDAVGGWDLKSLSEERDNGTTKRIPILINDEEHNLRFPDHMLGDFLCFYGIGEELCKRGTDNQLKTGMAGAARERLRTYWASCLG
ncbi:laminin domain protein, putative [Rhizoctonia solani AG-3 Rhs1AP]|uniref:Laminin domain protein, putative n=1 Tax=Rhizoctonia solani AG-3 Rhs1AP TaxID=1086054 RepID=A0A0A1UI24_9AGAM|nr:laminin domain protein, putative [Rhizoctonia solani AG-3 Rhs1AP]